MKEAMKSGDAVKRMVLSLLQSAIKNKELQKRAKSGKVEELNDEEIMGVIAFEAKKRKESVESYEKGGREELAQKERDELSILMEYMPEQMPEDEIREVVRQTIKEMALPAGALAKAGQVLSVLMPKLKGRADGTVVSKIVKEELAS